MPIYYRNILLFGVIFFLKPSRVRCPYIIGTFCLSLFPLDTRYSYSLLTAKECVGFVKLGILWLLNDLDAVKYSYFRMCVRFSMRTPARFSKWKKRVWMSEKS